jgi:lysozyme
MRTGTKGRAIIKKWEGLPKPLSNGLYPPYICPTGHWTLGYGSLKDLDGNPVTEDTPPITKDQAEELLDRMLPEYEGYVNSSVKVPLTQEQFDALVSWTYNLGPSNLRNSTMLERLNAGLYNEVPAQMQRWNKGRVDGKLVVLAGLKARREDEAALWASAPLGATPVAPPPVQAPVEAPRPLPEPVLPLGPLTPEEEAVLRAALEILIRHLKGK